MCMGSNPVDGTNLILSSSEKSYFVKEDERTSKYIRRYLGGNDILKGVYRYCLWIDDADRKSAEKISLIDKRLVECRSYRKGAGRDAKKVADAPHRFCYRTHREEPFIALPNHVENAQRLAVDYVGKAR